MMYIFLLSQQLLMTVFWVFSSCSG